MVISILNTECKDPSANLTACSSNQNSGFQDTYSNFIISHLHTTKELRVAHITLVVHIVVCLCFCPHSNPVELERLISVWIFQPMSISFTVTISLDQLSNCNFTIQGGPLPSGCINCILFLVF